MDPIYRSFVLNEDRGLSSTKADIIKSSSHEEDVKLLQVVPVEESSSGNVEPTRPPDGTNYFSNGSIQTNIDELTLSKRWYLESEDNNNNKSYEDTLSDLYVREKEIEILMESYRLVENEESSNKQSSKIVLIRGESGMGKTTLARSFLKQHRRWNNNINNNNNNNNNHHNHNNNHDHREYHMNTNDNYHHHHHLCACCRSYVYLEGKFDQVRRPELYRAYSSAVTESLCQFNERDRRILREDMERIIIDPIEIQALLEFIPKLGEYNIFTNSTNDIVRKDETTIAAATIVLGKQCTNDEAVTSLLVDDSKITSLINPPSLTLQNGFKHALSKVLSCLANTVHKINRSHLNRNPVVVFVLDDIHWAEETDLDLLFALISDASVCRRTLFVVTCWEDGDGAGFNFLGSSTNNTNMHTYTLDKIKHDIIHEIHLTNLSESQINTALCRRYKNSSDKSQELSTFVWKKTRGRIFSLSILLYLLEGKNAIRYDKVNGSYWDVMGLQIQYSSIDDLILATLAKLSDQVKEDLMVASCIGTLLDNEIIQFLNRESFLFSFEEASIKGIMRHCLVSNSWSFVHEKIQHIIYYSIPIDRRPEYHLLIGKMLWRHLDMSMLVSFIFLVVDHLVKGQGMMKSQEERTAVARLCCAAGERAAKSSAFLTARSYFKNGIALLETRRCWCDEYELSLDLYSGAAECSFSSGYVSEVHDYEAIILKHARTFDDTIRIRIMSVNALGSAGKWEQARDVGIKSIRNLGERFPTRFQHLARFVGMQRLRKRLWMRHNLLDCILQLPRMTEPRKLAVMQFLNMTMLYSVGFSIEWTALLAIRMINLTLDYGISDLSCFGFVLLGFGLCSKGHVNEGCRFGQIGHLLYNRFQNRSFLARFYCSYYNFVFPYQNPVKECIGPLSYSYQVGLETGDNECALLTGYDSCFYAFEFEALSCTEKGFGSLKKRIISLKQESTLAVADPFLKAVQYLMGNESGESSLICPCEGIPPMVQNYVFFPRILISYLFGNYDNGLAELAVCAYCTGRDTVVPHMSAMLTMFEGLCSVGMARQVTNHSTGQSIKRRIRRAEICCIRLRKFTKHEPYGFLWKLLILEAELATFQGNKEHEVLQKYIIAIAVANDCGSLLACAMANELCFKYLLRLGNRLSKATKHLNASLSFYSRWGAKAKIQHLQAEIERTGHASLLKTCSMLPL